MHGGLRWRYGIALAGMVLAGLSLATPLAFAQPSGPLGVPGMSEKKLRAAETEMLGPEHAAEHAQMREQARENPEGTASTAAEAAETEASVRAAGPPDQVGQWGSAFPIPIFGIAAVMLPTGKVMWWSYPFGPHFSANTSQAWLWDPATGTSKKVDPPDGPDINGDGDPDPVDIWCSGQSLLADGRVLVTGGNLEFPDPSGTPSWKGLNKVYTFNPFNETWTKQPDMSHGRWYPSQNLQPDGRTVIMSGLDETGTGEQDKTIDLFTPSPDMDGIGTLAPGGIAERGGSGPPEDELYPRMFVMPSGRTIVAGPNPGDSWYFNPIGPAPDNVFSWADLPNFNNNQSRLWSTSVLEPGGPGGSTKVTITGGSPFSPPAAPNVPQSTAETFDDANPGLGWQPSPSLNIGRSHANTVLLPDGSKVEVGGGVGSDPAGDGQWAFNPDQRQIEISDPNTGAWRLGPEQAEGRAYHSTAVLLPDGRVISAGDEINGSSSTFGDTAEIYSPPYLFKGARPAIGSAPPTFKWGDNFGVQSPDSISRAVLMAPSATTHGYDTNQREVPLNIIGSVDGQGVNVTAPPNANVAPPGYYMLFLLNAQGVPSVARWVRLDASAPDRPLIDPNAPPAPDPPTLTGSNPASGSNDNSPRILGSAVAGTTVDLFTNATCSTVAAATGTAADFNSSGLRVSVADNTNTRFYARATNNNGPSFCSASSVSYEEITPASGVQAAAAGATGRRAKALKKCKKKAKHSARKRCKKKARRLPI